ncbi:glutathione peroxidase [Niallia sp. 03133]|uniref:glutathione peroxidase n=1 Tax=Niallia sp. 03133 TaxID=3458060 RepID=UPI0040439FF2
MSVYEFEAAAINGETQSLQEFAGKVLVIVNTASKCGFTPQYKELQSLYEQYQDKGFTVLGFPCNQFMNQEPDNEKEIQTFCELHYGVSFPMFAKIKVNGKDLHPLFRYLTKEAPGSLGMKAIKWNFTKFLIERSGKVVGRYAPSFAPMEMRKAIEELL